MKIRESAKELIRDTVVRLIQSPSHRVVLELKNDPTYSLIYNLLPTLIRSLLSRTYYQILNKTYEFRKFKP